MNIEELDKEILESSHRLRVEEGEWYQGYDVGFVDGLRKAREIVNKKNESNS